MKPRDRELLGSVAAARRPVAITVALGVAVAVLTIAQAALLAHVLAAAAMDGAGLATLSGALVALAVVLCVRAAAAGAFELVGRRGAAAVLGELRERLAEHVLVRRPGAARTARTGELATVAVTGVDALEAYFARYLPQLVLAAVAPVLVLVWLLRADWLPALLLAGTLPLIPLFMVLVGRTTVEHTQARARTLSLLGAHFLDVVRGLPVLRAFGREDVQAQTLATVGERLRVETLATLRVAFLSALVLELLAMLGTALAAVTIGIQLVHGAISLEAGLVVLILAPELYLPLREVGAQYHASADGLEAAERLREVTAEPDADAAAPGRGWSRLTPTCDINLDHPVQELRMDGVAFAHPGRPQVLRDVSLTLGPEPELVALTGASGTGKTTIARLLLGLLAPDAGTVRAGDHDAGDTDPRAWRRRFVWVPQRPTIVTGTLHENVTLYSGAMPDLDWLPDVDPKTPLGEGGRVLSAGEAQRVALARAFAAADRPVVVLDEPTAHLDGDLAERVGDALRDLARERVVLVLTHDDGLAARADRVLHLTGGAVHDATPTLGSTA